MSIFMGAVLALIAFTVLFIKIPGRFGPLKAPVMALTLAGAGMSVMGGAVGYNDAGYCVHIRTVFGTESSKCDLGWFFSGWGNTTQYPHFITIAYTHDADAGGSSISGPYTVRMADNWAGDVTQTTRFGIPQDPEQFLKMARDFRSRERLITSTLRPAVSASLDSVANLFTMEEYYAGGRRDDFKTEFRDALIKGRAVVTRDETIVTGPDINRTTAPSASELSADTAETGGGERLRIVTKKKIDASGNEVRIRHGFVDYGIVVSTAILQNLDPDDAFEQQIKERKDAAARRSVAREKRLEQEEQRLLALAEAERAIAQRQGKAREDQIQRTTDAETGKRLALIAADQRREEARIAKETALLNLERAEIDARARRVAADAEAYEKEALLLADGALSQKLSAWVKSQEVWAGAFAQRRVPSTVFGGGGDGGTGSDFDAKTFMQLLTVQAAKQLELDMGIRKASAPGVGTSGQ
ncbi:MAG: SPFH domain-containing protein [Pseudomonadota bacterium]